MSSARVSRPPAQLKYYTTVFSSRDSPLLCHHRSNTRVPTNHVPADPSSPPASLLSSRRRAPKQSIQCANPPVALTDCFTVQFQLRNRRTRSEWRGTPIHTWWCLTGRRCFRRRTGSWPSSPPPAPASSRTRTAGRRRRDYRLRLSPRPRQTLSFSCGASGIGTGCRARSRSRRRWRREARCAGCLRWMDGRMDSKREESGEMRTARKIGRDERERARSVSRGERTHGLRLGGDVGRTVESLAAAGQRGRGRVRVVAAVEHVLDAVTLLAVEDGLPSLGKLTDARYESGGEGRSTKIQIIRARSGGTGVAQRWGLGGILSRGQGTHSWPMLARLMVTRRRMRRLRFGGLGELSFVGDYSWPQQTLPSRISRSG